MKNILVYLSFISGALLLLTNCRTEHKGYESTFSKQYPNENKIEVLRKDNYEQYFGIFSGHNYGGSHSFSYEFTIYPDQHKWKGAMNQVPRKIVFCEDKIFLAISEEKVKVDSLHPNEEPIRMDTVLYFENKDERYFFNWFGDQFFVPVDSSNYLLQKNNCTEEAIPYY